MTVSTEHPPAPRRPKLAYRWMLWYMVAVCWVALAGWVWLMVRQHFLPQKPRIVLAPIGQYHKVREIAGPTSLRLDGGQVVRLGGVAEPLNQAEAQAAKARLGELVPPGIVVYVETEPRPAGGDAPAGDTVFLPPPDHRQADPFPYDRSRVPAAVLVQEGLLRVRTDVPYRYLNEFLTLQDDARRHRRGVWAGAGPATQR